MDPEATSAALGYTWLTYWNLKEEDRQFRQHVFESTRGRSVQRHRQLLDLVAPPGADSAVQSASELPSSEDDTEMRIVNGRISIVSASDMSEASSGDGGVDELTWLASHPEATADDVGSSSSIDGNGHSRLKWTLHQPSEARSSPGAVQLRLAGDVATVRPLWVSVHQEEGSTAARLFESVVPLQTEVVERVSVDLTPFATVSGMTFGSLADLRFGAWANYFVGLVGEVAVDEEDILWPNQVLHRDRVLYNVRNAGDVARFLADPKRDDVDAHLLNLRRLAEERRYKRGWCWHMLKSRWGEGCLREFKITPENV